MAQYRYWDFLSPVTQRSSIFVNQMLNEPGIYTGLSLTVDINDNLVLTSGVGLQPDGILWYESDSRLLSFTAPGVATTYTVVATHVDEERPGGTEVEYSIVIGILPSIVDGVPVGWIYHPGGGVPLTEAMIQNAPKMRSGEYTDEKVALLPDVLSAEFTSGYYDSAASGPDTSLDPKLYTTSGQFLIYQGANNAAVAPSQEQVLQHFTFLYDGIRRPRSIELYLEIPSSPNNWLMSQIYDTDQVLVPITSNGTISPTTNWETKTVEIDRSAGTWTQGKPWELRFLFNLDPGQTISLARIKVSYWPYN